MASNLLNSDPVLAITITDKNGAQRRMHFTGAEIAIGRLDDNDLVLPKSNVSKRHARVVYHDGRCVVSDLQSTNGTYVNGRRINAPVAVSDGDKIYIGDYILSLSEVDSSESRPSISLPDLSPPDDDGGEEAAVGERPQALDSKTTVSASVIPPPLHGSTARSVPLVPARTGPAAGPTLLNQTLVSRPMRTSQTTSSLGDPERPHGQPATSPSAVTPASGLAPAVRLQGALATLVERLSEQRKGMEPELGGTPSDYLERLDTAMEALTSEGLIGPDLDRRFLREAAINELTGLGPLERLLREEHTRRIVVDHPTRVLVDQGKGLAPSNAFFSGAWAMTVVARRLLARGRVSLLPQSPMHEATLPEGDHVLVLSSPLVHPGPVITIRCARRTPVEAEQMVRANVLSSDTLRVLRDAIQTRRNLLVYGANEVDLSYVISGLSGLAAAEERLLAIETSPGLAIDHPQVLTLTHHQAAVEYTPLLQRAAHFACDRIILDDIKMHAASAVLSWASHTRGMLMGIHTNGQESGLKQLRTAALLAGHGDGEVLHHLIARAVQLTVEVQKERDGQLRIATVNQIIDRDGHPPEERPLYTHSKETANGRPSFLPE